MYTTIHLLEDYRLSKEPQLSNEGPFYKRHLEKYLGASYSSESYESLLDEVAADVERRMKEFSS